MTEYGQEFSNFDSNLKNLQSNFNVMERDIIHLRGKININNERVENQLKPISENAAGLEDMKRDMEEMENRIRNSFMMLKADIPVQTSMICSNSIYKALDTLNKTTL